MKIPENPDSLICLDGDILPTDSPEVQELVNSASFSEGCFETMRWSNGIIPLMSLHFERLERSLDFLNRVKPADLSPSEVLRVSTLLAGERKTPHRVRLTIFPDGQNRSRWMIQVTEVQIPGRPFRVLISNVPRNAGSKESLGCKLSRRIDYRNAAREASAQGFDDAVLLTPAGFVSESAIANIFWVKSDVVYIPSVSSLPLQGTGMRVLKEAFLRGNVHFVEGDFLPDALFEADAVFLINAVRGVLPVIAIDNHDIPISEEVVAFYRNIFENEVLRYV